MWPKVQYFLLQWKKTNKENQQYLQWRDDDDDDDDYKWISIFPNFIRLNFLWRYNSNNKNC